MGVLDSILDPLRDARDAFRFLRTVVDIRRSLRSIASTLEAFRLAQNIPTVAEQIEERRRAEQEATDLERDPSSLRQPSVLDVALDDLRERRRRGEPIEDDEVLAAARAIEDEEDSRTTVW